MQINPTPITYADVERAAAQLLGQAHHTPVLTSRTIDERTQSHIFFKCENFQRTGSFKFRGAFNALSQLSAAQRQAGVIAFSSGNHAQALALAGQILAIPTTIVMPQDAPQVKQAATQGYGAEVILYDRATTDRAQLTVEIAQNRGLTVIPPYDHPEVIAGQGTTAKELWEEVGDLDVLLVPCGGGGLLSGCAIATRHLSPHCCIIGVEPKRADDATRSFYSRTLQTVENPQTIADGARSHCLGEWTFPLILQHVSDMVTVSDAALLRTTQLLWERLKIVVEPTGALAATALLEGVVSRPQQRIGVIISGGNVDVLQVSKLFKPTRSTPKSLPKRPWAPEWS